MNPDLAKQLGAFLARRDSDIDHELFGAFEGFRDLQFAPPLEREDFKPYEGSFRRIFPLDRAATAPLICLERLADVAAFYMILPDKIVKLKTEIENEDASLADPPIYSNKQFNALITSQRAGVLIKMLSEWIISRAPAGRSQMRLQLYKRIERMLFDAYREARSSYSRAAAIRDDDIIRRIYSVLYNRAYPYQTRHYTLPNSAKRVTTRYRELTDLFHMGKIQPQVDSALDIGCAEGAFIGCLKTHLKLETAVGMDIRAPAAIAGVEFVEASALERVERFERRFDLVCISMTLHHIPHYKSVLENACRYLRRGGYLFIREHDAVDNDYKLLLDIHDQCFNGCLWEEPESPIFEFQQHARSWFLSQLDVVESVAALYELELVALSNGKERDYIRDMFGRVWFALWRKL